MEGAQGMGYIIDNLIIPRMLRSWKLHCWKSGKRLKLSLSTIWLSLWKIMCRHCSKPREGLHVIRITDNFVFGHIFIALLILLHSVTSCMQNFCLISVQHLFEPFLNLSTVCPLLFSMTAKKIYRPTNFSDLALAHSEKMLMDRDINEVSWL